MDAVVRQTLILPDVVLLVMIPAKDHVNGTVTVAVELVAARVRVHVQGLVRILAQDHVTDVPELVAVRVPAHVRAAMEVAAVRVIGDVTRVRDVPVVQEVVIQHAVMIALIHVLQLAEQTVQETVPEAARDVPAVTHLVRTHVVNHVMELVIQLVAGTVMEALKG